MKLQFWKPNLPTDLEVLECIYNKYYKTFASFTKGSRITKLYVPIDFDLIGRKLGVDGDIPFGYLYYHLNSKHSYKNDEGQLIDLFALNMESDSKREKHLVQFPLMASILAELKSERKKHRTQVLIGWISLFISLLAVIVSVGGKMILPS